MKRGRRGERPSLCPADRASIGGFLPRIDDAVNEMRKSGTPPAPIKIGAKVISHRRYVAFQMAEVGIPRSLSIAWAASACMRPSALRVPSKAGEGVS